MKHWFLQHNLKVTGIISLFAVVYIMFYVLFRFTESSTLD